MKIKVESEKIVKAVKKLAGIEIVVENTEDAEEGLDLILHKTDLFKSGAHESLKEIKVSSFQKYETSAVDYKLVFLLEFVFKEELLLDARVSLIKGLQDFFQKL